MYYSSQKRKKDLILVKPIQKSNYLKNLEKQRYEGLKLIEEEKAEILIEKILRRGKIYRDYSIFSKHKPKNLEEKFLTTENNSNRIKNNNINILHKNSKSQNKYKIYNTPNFHNRNNNLILTKMAKETFITRNLENRNFLSIIGDDIMKSNNLINDKKKYGNKKKIIF